MMKKLITIVGPTAVGKTDLTIKLAKKYNTDVISGDAYQVYKGLDIGTAKPCKEEMQGVRHYLIDILEPEEEYSVATFQNQAKKIISEQNDINRIPLLSGGTGLYVQALLEGYDFSDVKPDYELRAKLEAIYENEGIEKLIAYAQELAAPHEVEIIFKDKHRLYRTIELLSKGDVDALKNQSKQGLMYDGVVIGLRRDRQELYARINKRVDNMVEQGLFAEVEGLVAKGLTKDSQSMKGIGYKEVLLYIDGEITKEACIELIKKNTRNFAKRQITWYKRMPYIKWIDINEDMNSEEIFNKAIEIIENEDK